MIRRISLVGLLASAVIAVGFLLFGAQQQAINSLFGSVVVTVNLIILTVVLNLIFVKKSFALALILIVSKYAGLILLLVLLYRSGWHADIGFVVGVSAMFPVLIVIARDYLKRVK